MTVRLKMEQLLRHECGNGLLQVFILFDAGFPGIGHKCFHRITLTDIAVNILDVQFPPAEENKADDIFQCKGKTADGLLRIGQSFIMFDKYLLELEL